MGDSALVRVGRARTPRSAVRICGEIVEKICTQDTRTVDDHVHTDIYYIVKSKKNFTDSLTHMRTTKDY